jgi:hypothetical protein
VVGPFLALGRAEGDLEAQFVLVSLLHLDEHAAGKMNRAFAITQRFQDVSRSKLPQRHPVPPDPHGGFFSPKENRKSCEGLAGVPEHVGGGRAVAPGGREALGATLRPAEKFLGFRPGINQAGQAVAFVTTQRLSALRANMFPS